MSKQEQKPIESEQVTIKIPKPIMVFLRSQAILQKISIEEEIEYDLLDNVRAVMEGMTGEDLIAMLDLGRIFYELLGDEQYKPKEPQATQN